MSQHPTTLEPPLLRGARVASEVLGKACRAEAWQLSDDQVEDALATVLAVKAKTAALEGMLLREAEQRSLRDRTQALSMQGWLGHRSGCPGERRTGPLRPRMRWAGTRRWPRRWSTVPCGRSRRRS